MPGDSPFFIQTCACGSTWAGLRSRRRPPRLPTPAGSRCFAYYDLLNHVCAVCWEDFNGGCLTSSMPGRAPRDIRTTRLAPNGGSYYTRESVVCVYRMLNERRFMSLDHSQVNTIPYLDATMFRIAMRDRLGKCDGRMAAFSANSGGGGLRFRVCHGREPQSFTAAA